MALRLVLIDSRFQSADVACYDIELKWLYYR